MQEALKDKRLNPENVRKGKNPTNVWEIGRLNGNSLERVGHPTQKPLEIMRRFVKALSYPDSIVLDFFAGSGTTGRACIEEKRNCVMRDKDELSKTFFSRHLTNMKASGLNPPFVENEDLSSFFAEIRERNNHKATLSSNNTITIPIENTRIAGVACDANRQFTLFD
ncbi:MAG: site-specific DNA-methyltransferase [Bacteroidales bacterium]|nr:site-specific DNA-methyltransferase [Bacteroidales bacterium]